MPVVAAAWVTNASSSGPTCGGATVADRDVGLDEAFSTGRRPADTVTESLRCGVALPRPATRETLSAGPRAFVPVRVGRSVSVTDVAPVREPVAVDVIVASSVGVELRVGIGGGVMVRGGVRVGARETLRVALCVAVGVRVRVGGGVRVRVCVALPSRDSEEDKVKSLVAEWLDVGAELVIVVVRGWVRVGELDGVRLSVTVHSSESDGEGENVADVVSEAVSSAEGEKVADESAVDDGVRVGGGVRVRVVDGVSKKSIAPTGSQKTARMHDKAYSAK
jgi:hypothetical protein